MIYTSCFHICPTTTRNLALAIAKVNSAVDKGAYRVLTIGFDAKRDTPEAMAGYARQQGVSREKNWRFLSADAATITRLTADLGFLYMPSVKGFDHLIQTTVVDREGKVFRHVYGMEVDHGLLTQAMKETVFGSAPATFSLASVVSRVRLFCTTYDPSSDTYKVNYAMVISMLIGLFMVSLMGFFLVRFLRNA